MMKNIKLILLLQFLVFSVCAQDKSLSPSINSRVVNEDGTIKFVTFKDNKIPNFKNGANVLKQFLKTSNSITYVKLESVVDKIGMMHEKYQQYYNGFPVEFGIYRVHSKNQTLSSINGDFYPIKEINTTPSISKLDAVSKAKQHVNAEKYIEESDIFYHNMGYNGPKPTLVIFPKLKGINKVNRLAYKLDICSETPLYRADVYVDAQTGNVIFENNKIHQADVPATGMTLYNGTQGFKAEEQTVATGMTYRLRQTTSGNGIQTFDMVNTLIYANAQDITSTTANFTSNPFAVQTHWATEKTYDYYFQMHGRNSYDGNDAILKSYINYGNGNLPNAFWNGSVLSYNHGNGTTIGPMVSLDIVGHEISHGVIQTSANLMYSYQPGALNESFADIFGEMVESFTLQGANDWLLGADVHTIPNEAFRSMLDPKSKNQPDTYLGQYWHTSSSDNFGVHINSGVQNKWFYLLSEGGTGTNDNNDSYSITGIGKIKAAEIAYRNLTVYLTPNSNFFDARAGAIQAANTLYGVNSTEAIATVAAWNAVGVGALSSDVTVPTTPLNLISSNVTEYNVDLSWNASTDNIGVVGYNIYKDLSIIATSSTTNYQVQEYMPPNTVYDFTVVAFDAAGNISGLSNIESVWVDTNNPSIPINITSSNTTEMSTDLSWDASNDNFSVVGYNVYEGNIFLTTVSNTTYSVTGLTPSSTYNFTVTSIDDSGNESGMSTIESVNTLSPCASSNVTLTINLDMYPEETSWDIKDSTNTVIASDGNYLAADANTTVVYTITLASGYYTLNMYDSIGSGGFGGDGLIPPGGYTLESNVVIATEGPYGPLATIVSTPFCINPDLVLVNPDFQLINAVKILNTENGIRVETDNSVQFKNYTLYSLIGMAVSTGKEPIINTDFLSSGIYILKLDFDRGKIAKKIIIN